MLPVEPPNTYTLRRADRASLLLMAMATLKGWGHAREDGQWKSWNRDELRREAVKEVSWALGETELSCGFCFKSNIEVKTLIAGPVNMICNECIALSAEIVAEFAAASAAKSDGT